MGPSVNVGACPHGNGGRCPRGPQRHHLFLVPGRASASGCSCWPTPS